MSHASPRTAFGRALRAANPSPDGRRWLFVPYDQLTDATGPLSQADPREVGIVMIETTWKPKQRAYHRQKLALILANSRHFALEQAERGVAVRYVPSDKSYGAVLAELKGELGEITCMQPAERELHVDIAAHVTVVPHTGWLSCADDFKILGEAPWRMDKFYRHMRQRTGFLMENDKPVGGKWSYDTENRKRWPHTPPAPSLPTFKPDAITEEVGALIANNFSDHYGTLKLENLPATHADAEAVWRWARKECLPHFGPFEDAMSQHSRSLFHSRISQLVNIHRLLPKRMVTDALASDIPLASKEGFVRQILGWREFVHHVYIATDGLRRVPTRNFFGAEVELPEAYWGQPSGLHCLDTVVREVWDDGYSHHITRLMVLSNIATLLGYNPQQLSDWFWIAYTDAYDWVVEPNVLGMGTHALGPLMMTKPYVSGAAYINKMSDYCGDCAFSPQKNCPITSWYWAFLERHAKLLHGNHRMQIPLSGLKRRDAAQKALDAERVRWAQQTLGAGKALHPDALPQ